MPQLNQFKYSFYASNQQNKIIIILSIFSKDVVEYRVVGFMKLYIVVHGILKIISIV